MLRIFAEVESAPGVVMGSGPITDLTMLKTSSRLNQAGSWSMTLPANATNADLLAAQRTVICYVMIDGVKTFIGGGALDRMRRRMGSDGRLTLECSGIDLIGEWSREALETLVLDDTGPNNLEEILFDHMLPTWTTGIIGTSGDFKRAFVNETLLTVLAAVAKQMGHFFASRGATLEPRTLHYFVDPPSFTALTCVMNLDALEAEGNPEVATIVSIEEVETSHEIMNRVYPYGAGSGENALTLAAATTWPDGTTDIADPYIAASGDEYFCNKPTNRITNADAYARLGDQLRSKRMQWPEISLLENSDNGLIAAANTLVQAAVAYLERQRIPQVVYRMKLADLRTRIYPGDRIHIDARQWVEGERILDVDADVTVLSVSDVLDANGQWTADVEASNIAAWPEEAVSQVAQAAQLARVQQAHPQLTGNVDTMTYRVLLAGGTPLERIWVFLANETALINEVVLRYQRRLVVLPLAESAPYSPAGGTHDYSGDGHIEQVTLMHSGNTNDTTSANPDLGHHHATLSVASHVHYHSIDDHTLIYGYSTADPDLTYSGAVLEFNINGETSGGLVWRQGSIFSGAGVTAWYELDITDLVRDPVTKRPYDESIFIDVWPELAAQDAAFSCNVDIQVQIRSVLQQKATF